MMYLITSGSRLYGTAREDSDHDIRGVYLESPEQIYGFRPSNTIEKKDPDTVIYPLKRFCHLALNANPNILEVLFADDRFRLQPATWFEPFLSIRRLFLSQQVRHTYGGYAHAQRKKVENGESPSKNTRQHLVEAHGYDTKYAAHSIRLLLQGKQILTQGDFSPTLMDNDLSLVLSVLHGHVEKDDFLELSRLLEQELHAVSSSLPLLPDQAQVEARLITAYKEYL